MQVTVPFRGKKTRFFHLEGMYVCASKASYRKEWVYSCKRKRDYWILSEMTGLEVEGVQKKLTLLWLCSFGANFG